jgi:hypothetical protein
MRAGKCGESHAGELGECLCGESRTGCPGEQPAAQRESPTGDTGTLSWPRPLARPTLSTATALVAEWAAMAVAFRRVVGERQAWWGVLAVVRP